MHQPILTKATVSKGSPDKQADKQDQFTTIILKSNFCIASKHFSYISRILLSGSGDLILDSFYTYKLI